MEKGYDKWNEFKKNLEFSERTFFVHPREVWWCSLGINVGTEIDGKNENFERPMLVMNVYNRDTILVLPFTTKPKNDRFHYRLIICSISPVTQIISIRMVWLKLTQARVINRKRLWRKVDILFEDEFQEIRERFKEFT